MEEDIITRITRRRGRTSRLVDFYIQELFTKGEIEVRDHYDHKNAHRFLLSRIVNRYNNEYSKSFQTLIIKDLNVKLSNYESEDNVK